MNQSRNNGSHTCNQFTAYADFQHWQNPVRGFIMKKDIHPKTFEAKITCACGYSSDALSTKGDAVAMEICSHCHPFFTGKQRFLDTAGRIDRFRKKYASVQK